MEIITFGHFSDVSWMGVPFVMSLTTMRTHAEESNMAAVFVGLHLCTYQWYAPPPPPGDRWGKGGDLTNQEWLILH